MKALSIKQPWASLIAHGIKDIENRTWKTNFRGRIYIHATGSPSNEPYQIFTDEQWREIELKNFDPEIFESYKNLSRIIGSVYIVDCVINHPSIWADKTEGVYDINTNEFIPRHTPKPIYNWVLSDPVLYEQPFLNVKGKLSLWQYDNHL